MFWCYGVASVYGPHGLHKWSGGGRDPCNFRKFGRKRTKIFYGIFANHEVLKFWGRPFRVKFVWGLYLSVHFHTSLSVSMSSWRSYHLN